MSAQLPAAHIGVARTVEHRRPHAPQLLTVLVGTSQPLVGLPSQSAKPVAQLPTRHAPETHEPSAFGGLHARPQAPQCSASDCVFTHEAPQVMVPAGQTILVRF